MLTLREIARWHDGRPITADDVVFSFETLATRGSPQYRFIYHWVSAVEKLGEWQV